jgi:hypothetical protein
MPPTSSGLLSFLTGENRGKGVNLENLSLLKWDIPYIFTYSGMNCKDLCHF